MYVYMYVHVGKKWKKNKNSLCMGFYRYTDTRMMMVGNSRKCAFRKNCVYVYRSGHMKKKKEN